MSSLRICLVCCVGTLAVLPARASADDGDVASVTLHVRENAAAGSPVGVVGSGEGTCRYSIVTGNQEAAFAIDARSGRLTVDNAAALDHERRDRFDLILRVERPTADDSARRAFLRDVLDSGAPLNVVEELMTETEEVRVAVLVDDAAERPVLPMQTVTVTASGREATVGARIEARDEDRNDALHFEILGGAPGNLFDLDSNSGRLRIDQAVALPPGVHEYPLTVQVTDSSGESDATTITVRAIVLAGPPASLVVAAPPPVSAAEAAAEPSPPVADGGEASEDAGGESIASTPVVPVTEDVESRADSAAPQDAEGNEGPPVEATGGRLLVRVGGMFLLLAVAVAGAVWWLKRRALRKALAEDERSRRLQLISNEGSTQPAVDEMGSATGELDLEESVTQELRGLQQLLTEQSQAHQVTSEHRNAEGDAAPDPVELSAHKDEDAQAGHSSRTGPPDATAPTDLPRESPLEQNEDENERYEVSEDDSYEFEPDEDETIADVSGESDKSEAQPDFGGLFEWNENEVAPAGNELFESVDDEEPLQVADQQWTSALNQDPVEFSGGPHEVDESLQKNGHVEQAREEPESTLPDGQFDDVGATSAEDGLFESVTDASRIAAPAPAGHWSPPEDREAVDTAIEAHEAPWDESATAGAVGMGTEESGNESPGLRGLCESDSQTASAPVPTSETRNDELLQAEVEKAPQQEDQFPPAAGGGHRGSQPTVEGGGFFEPVNDEPQFEAAASVEEATPQGGAVAAVPEVEPVVAATDGRNEENATTPEQQGLMEILREGAPLPVGAADEDATDRLAGWSEAFETGQNEFVPGAGAEDLETGIDAGGAPDPYEAPAVTGEPLETVENVSPLDPAADKHSGEFPHPELLGETRGQGAELSADPTFDASDQAEVLLDARVRQLREQIAQKLGTGAGDSSSDSDPSPTEPLQDSSGAECEPLGAPIASGESPAAPLEESPGDELSRQDIQGDEGWGGGLSTARFLLGKVPEAPPAPPEPIPEAVAPAAPAAAPQPVKVKRRNKSEIRRELSSLREVAIRHARSRMAQEAPRQQMRRTWYVSACIMVVLNVAAMGVMAAGPTGLLKLIGWTLMLGGACALAVCLHSFSQMDADDGLPHGARDEAEQSSAGDSGS